MLNTVGILTPYFFFFLIHSRFISQYIKGNLNQIKSVLGALQKQVTGSRPQSFNKGSSGVDSCNFCPLALFSCNTDWIRSQQKACNKRARQRGFLGDGVMDCRARTNSHFVTAHQGAIKLVFSFLLSFFLLLSAYNHWLSVGVEDGSFCRPCHPCLSACATVAVIQPIGGLRGGAGTPKVLRRSEGFE